MDLYNLFPNRILKDESNGKLNLSTMPAHLKRLVGHFDGEDASMDESLQEFQETKVKSQFYSLYKKRRLFLRGRIEKLFKSDDDAVKLLY